MSKWYFPYGKDIEPESVNNARIETFRDNILESLARETCQNSLDACLDANKPVRLEFECKQIDTDKITNKDIFLQYIIPLSRETWDNDMNAQSFLDKYEDILKSKKINILRVSDYNTTGLKGQNWDSLIEKAGTSYKNDVSSAGSFGIGKSAPFASSELRMVFYSTKLEDGIEKSIGVTKFISYYMPNGMTTQGVGYVGKEGKKPFNTQKTFGFKKRETPGTDIYVIGFKKIDNWSDEIILSLIESFMVSIYNDSLEIGVEDVEINKNTMRDLIYKLDGEYKKEKDRYNIIKNYYSVLDSEASKKIMLDERFEKYGFKKEDGYLLISQSKDANRSVLMTRKAGMKIKDRKGISGSIQFNGIFQATGVEFNEMLKKMENPNHNDWIPERYEDNKKLASKLLKDIYQFIKSNIITHYEEKIEKQVDAFGISDFLPNRLQEKNKSREKQEGLSLNITDVILKPRKIKNIREESLEGKDIEKRLVEAGIIDGNEKGLGTVIEGKGRKKRGPNNKSGVGEKGGINKKDEDGIRTLVIDNNRFKKTNAYKARIIEIDYQKGEYRIILSGKKTIKKIKLELKLVGESGYGYKEEILFAKMDGKQLKCNKNSILIDNLSETTNVLDIILPYKNRVKIGVDIYDYR